MCECVDVDGGWKRRRACNVITVFDGRLYVCCQVIMQCRQIKKCLQQLMRVSLRIFRQQIEIIFY